ncbi:MAG: trigger factor [Deltaproteobacteria bacterium CG11_big_fil_rev_8_21_14_0_20_45_16]|nr:MAG: trigger factor [Deltaproteobacteria bacterium CG11_big_fil_rev_8_21_14_0_20_45_16]
MTIKENLQKNSSVQARLKIEMAPERVNNHLNTFYGGLAKRAKIQGFRPGKAPLDLVKKVYGEEASNEVTQRMVSESLMEVVRKHDLKLILPPTLIAVDSPKENTSFTFEAELDLKPEVPEIPWDKLEIENTEKQTATPEMIEDQLKEIQDRFTHYHAIHDDRPVKEDDMVVVRYDGLVDGQKVEQASTDRQELALGRGQVAEDFEKAVLGKKKGDKSTFTLPFPETHQVEEVRGKDVVFELEILEIQSKHTPELNDDLAKKVNPKYSCLDELRKEIETNLVSSLELQQTKNLQDKVGDKLVESMSFEISPRQKQMTAESLARDSIQRMFQAGIKEDDIKGRQAEIMEASAKNAERQIRLAYILDRIARDQEIKVEKVDIDKRLQKTASATGLSVSEIEKYYSQKDEEESISRMDKLKLDILDEKSLDYALSKARIK